MNKLSMIIIPAYIVVISLIIVYIGRKVKTYKDFAIGGGKIPWYVVSGTMLATSIGGGTLIGYAGSYYSYGLQWLWMAVGIMIANVIMTVSVAKRVKGLNQYTLPDILKLRYGRGARLAGAVIVLLGEFAVVCAMMASFGAMLSSFVGVSFDVALIIGVVLFIITATLGGLVGVAYTDAIQAVLIIGGVVIVSFLTFTQIGGFAGFQSLEPQLLNIFSENVPNSIMIGNVLSAFILAFVSQSIFFQRVNSCKNPDDAKKSMILNSILSLFVGGIGITVMGLGARVIFGSGLQGNDVIGQLLTTVPPIIAALYAAAIISAVLTTANSLLLSTSMNLARDIFQELRKDISDRNLVVISKVYIVVATLIAFVIVKYYSSVIGLILIAYTLNACLFVPTYFGLLSKKPGEVAGLLSLALSGIGTVIWSLMKNPFNIHAVFVGIGLGIIGLLIGTAVGAKPTQEQMDVVDIFKAGENYVGSDDYALEEEAS